MKPEAGQLIIDAFKVALDFIDNFVGNDGPTYERVKRGLDAAEDFFKNEQPQPAEDPDEWVVQDRVPARKHDEARWVGSMTSEWCQVDRFPDALGLYHGYTDDKFLLRLEVRCRRRDLPKVEQAVVHYDPIDDHAKLVKKPEPQPQKTRVRLWMRNEPKGRPSLFACDERPYPDSHKYVEIHHDAEGFYTID